MIECKKIIDATGKEMIVGSDIRDLSYMEEKHTDMKNWDDETTVSTKLTFLKVGGVRGFTYDNKRYSAAVYGGKTKGWKWGGYFSKELNKYYTPPSKCSTKKPKDVNTNKGTGKQYSDKFINPIAKGF